MRLIPCILLALPLLAQQILPPGPSTLTTVLSLTADQAQKIGALFTDYDNLRRTGDARMRELNFDLAFNLSQPNPNPAQIGADYAEAEAIRRNIAAKQASYRAQVRAILTPAQQTQYQALLDSITLQPLLIEASCAYLTDSGSFASFLIGPYTTPTVVQRNGDFSLSAVFSPYMPPAPGPTFCGSPMFPLALREYLNITDAQVAAIAQASTVYNDFYERRQDRIADVRVEIRDETAKDQPDPVALGLRYIELQSISQELQAQAAQLRNKARSVLTADQSARLKTLDNLVAVQPALSTLSACDLLVVPPGTQSPVLPGVIFTTIGSVPNLIPDGSCRIL